MSSPGQQSVSRHKPLTVNGAVLKLLEKSKSISTYGEIKPKESTRAVQAFSLLSKSSGSNTSKTDKRRESYRVFLQRVNDISGSQGVLLSAVGLGQSALSNMRGKDRLLLPSNIKMHQNTWTSEPLQNIALKYSSPGMPELADCVQDDT
jgi:hypothetical protein